jgi:hypothetical protein
MNINYLRNFYVSRVTYLTTPRSAPACDVFQFNIFVIFAVFVQLIIIFAILWNYQEYIKVWYFILSVIWSGNPTFYPFKVLDTLQFMLDVFRCGWVGWGENVISPQNCLNTPVDFHSHILEIQDLKNCKNISKIVIFFLVISVTSSCYAKTVKLCTKNFNCFVKKMVIINLNYLPIEKRSKKPKSLLLTPASPLLSSCTT